MRTRFARQIALLTIVALLSSLCLIFCACNNKSLIEKTFSKATVSDDGYATVYMPLDGGDLKIMVLSDPQVDVSEKYNAVGSLGIDKTYSFIKDLVTATSPDLVIINGDMVMSTLPNNAPYFKRYAELFEEIKTPWMPVFGNHDSENGFVNETVDLESKNWQMTKDTLISYLSEFDHCLINSDEKCEDGYGNYFVNVRKQDGSLAYTLCAFDCVYNPQYTLFSSYSSYMYTPTAKQVEWYRDTINSLSDAEYGADRNESQIVKSMIFNHVGIPEFKAAWDAAWNNGNPTADYFYGRYFDGDYSSKYDELPTEDQIFSAAKALGSTTAIFMCHHHDNDFSVNYQGIRLTFGQHSGVSHNYRTEHSANGLNADLKDWKDVDFSRIDDYGNQRGGTQVTISADGAFEITPVYAETALSNFYTDYYIDYDLVAAEIEASPKYTSGTVIRGTERKWKQAA